MSGLPAGITHGIPHMIDRLQRACGRTDRPMSATITCDALLLVPPQKLVFSQMRRESFASIGAEHVSGPSSKSDPGITKEMWKYSPSS